jgi:hypothetical protein
MWLVTPRGKVIRFPKMPAPAAAPDGLAEARRCRHHAEALVIRSLLESEGIPTALRSNLAPSVHPFSVGEQGVTIVLVPAAAVEHAREILGRRRPKLPWNVSSISRPVARRARTRES